jgi:hypothetical protein
MPTATAGHRSRPVKGSVRDEDAAGVAEAPLVVWVDVLATELELVAEDVAEVWDELGADAGALLLDGDEEAGVVEASGSTYCWLPADCPRAAGAASSARTAQSKRALHALRRLSIV